MKSITFLTLAEVIEIHSDQIQRYGGTEGTRDINLLSSAVAMPYASFSGSFFHSNIYEMAAAYAFYICRNHPFVDGNKRTALASPLVFLELNGISISDPKGKLYKVVISLAKGNLGKTELEGIFKSLKK